MKSPYSHFYLYAKGWYKRSDNMESDLLTILSDFSGISKDLLNLHDLFSVLSELVWKEIERSSNPQRVFTVYSDRLRLSGFYQACMLVLCTSKKYDYQGHLFFRPNPNILPLTDDVTWDEVGFVFGDEE